MSKLIKEIVIKYDKDLKDFVVKEEPKIEEIVEKASEDPIKKIKEDPIKKIKEKYQCECGAYIVRQSDIARHKLTKKHLKLMEKQVPEIKEPIVEKEKEPIVEKEKEPIVEKEKVIESEKEEEEQTINEFYDQRCQKVFIMYKTGIFKNINDLKEFNKKLLNNIRPKIQEEILQQSGTEFLKKYNIINTDKNDIDNFHFNFFFNKIEEECLMKIIHNIHINI